METETRLAILELLLDVHNWTAQRLANKIIEVEYYDVEHGRSEEVQERLETSDQKHLVTLYLPIYEKQLWDLDAESLADLYVKEIVGLSHIS